MKIHMQRFYSGEKCIQTIQGIKASQKEINKQTNIKQ